MSNYNELSTEELKDMAEKISKTLKKREAKETTAAKRQIIEIANLHHISLTELAETEVVYRSPDDQWTTWNGKGRKPKWVEEWLKSGKKLEDLKKP